MDAELVDRRALSCSRYAADADAHGVAAVGQAFLNDLLCLRLMIGQNALHERHGLTEDGDIAFDDAFHHLVDGEFAPLEASALQVWVDDGCSGDAAIHGQSFVFFAVFGVFHDYYWVMVLDDG